MRVATEFDRFFYAVVRIESGPPDRPFIGNGFFLTARSSEPNAGSIYLVTNRHVVRPFNQGRLILHRGADASEPALAPHSGNVVSMTIQDWSTGWVDHPEPTVVVSVLNVGAIYAWARENHQPIFLTSFRQEDVAAGGTLSNLDSLEEVFYVAHPEGVWDEAHNLPILRRGTTASPAFESFGGRPGFLVDGAIHFGVSGSPVIAIKERFPASMATVGFPPQVHLLGILSEAFETTGYERPISTEIPGRRSDLVKWRMPMNLGFAFRAEVVESAIAEHRRRVPPQT
jgi:hypothetical protein